MSDSETSQKLHLLEQNVHSVSTQNQQFQAQLFELEGALKELQTAKNAYKIIGGILIHTDTATLTSELESKKEIIELRVQTSEKQEKQLKEKIKKLQEQPLAKE